MAPPQGLTHLAPGCQSQKCELVSRDVSLCAKWPVTDHWRDADSLDTVTPSVEARNVFLSRTSTTKTEIAEHHIAQFSKRRVHSKPYCFIPLVDHWTGYNVLSSSLVSRGGGT